MGGYESEPAARISTELTKYPTNFYGATKVFGERLGRNYADRHDISVICLRLGWAPAVNEAHLLRGHPVAQQRWLSDPDFCGYVEHAISAHDDVRFAIVNATSAVEGSRWDLTEGARVLGYEPQDKFVQPRVGIARTLGRKLYGFIKRESRRFRK